MKIKIFAKERRNGRLHCYTADSLQAFRTLADSATEKGGEVRSIEVESIAETPDAVRDYAHEHNIMLREAPGFVLHIADEDEPELVGEIVDIFENFLDEKGISIENDEKDGYDDDEAIIYGSDYDEIADGIRNVLKSWSNKK